MKFHFIITLTLLSTTSFAQEVNVETFTGKPHVVIPIFSLQHHDISASISMSYDPNGVNLEKIDDQHGVGWSLIAGGEITRSLKGLPDDYAGSSTDNRRGWLHGTFASEIASFTDNTDESESTCSDENNLYDLINGLNYLKDTEPDIFDVSAPGLNNIRFVFDNSGNARLLSPGKEQVIISPTSKSNISYFKVISETGFEYLFNKKEQITRTYTKNSNLPDVEVNAKEYNYFKDQITYTTSWKLSRISSPSGATISFSYNEYTGESSSNQFKVYSSNADASSFFEYMVYRDDFTPTHQVLNSISTSDGKELSLNYGSYSDFDDPILDITYTESKNPEFFNQVLFNYEMAGREPDISGSHKWRFLRSIQRISQCDNIPPYYFDYHGVDYTTGTTLLPSKATNAKDYWGFFNGKFENTISYPAIYAYPSYTGSKRYQLEPLPSYTGEQIILEGADRSPDKNALLIGTLNKITTPEKGTTKIISEPYEYYDNESGQTKIGGGIRVGEIRYFDAVNLDKEIIRSYNYNDLAGKSSGVLVNKPAYAIPSRDYYDYETGTRTYHGNITGNYDKYRKLTLRSSSNIAENEGSNSINIGYTFITVSTPGKGKKEYSFKLSAEYKGTTVNEWTPTVNKFIRSTLCPTIGIYQAGIYNYPHASNSNFSFDQGLPISEITYNESGQKVHEVKYQHKRVNYFSKIVGLAYENYPYYKPIYLYGRYELLAGGGTRLGRLEEIVYDEQDINKNSSKVTEYFYSSNYHSRTTKITYTSPEGSVKNKYFQYVEDILGSYSSGDDLVNQLNNLKTNNRVDEPIEEYSTRIISGTEKAIEGKLILFDDYSSISAKPSKLLSFTNINGISDFKPAYVGSDGTTNVLYYESGAYEEISNIIAYDTYFKPVNIKYKTNDVVAKLWGYDKRIPVANISGAYADEVLFTNFESYNTSSFTESNVRYSYAARTGVKSAHPGTKLTGSIIYRTGNESYRASFWYKSSTSLNVDVIIKSGSSIISSQTVTCPGSSEYTFKEIIMPSITGFGNGAELTVEIEATGLTVPAESYSFSDPVWDDVLVVPFEAQFSSSTYSLPYGATSATDVSGITQYIEYDGLGRVKYVKDQDKNILTKTKYSYNSDPAPVFVADIKGEYGQSYVDDNELYFYGSGECIDGVTYEWDTGSGYIEGERTLVHVFSDPGTYDIKLRMTHPVHGVSEVTKSFKIEPGPLQVDACMEGVAHYDYCNFVVLQTADCPEITELVGEMDTMFKVIGITGGDGGYTYKWEYKVDDGVDNWTEVLDNNTDTYVRTVSNNTIITRCTVTDVTGHIGTSAEMIVYVESSECL